jgi:hypothetical protein
MALRLAARHEPAAHVLEGGRFWEAAALRNGTGIAALHWAFGPTSKFTSKLNASEATAYFQHQLAPRAGFDGAGIDEWAPPSPAFARNERPAAIAAGRGP